MAYHVKISGEALLSIEIGAAPIQLHLTAKDGQTLTFSYAGSPGGGKTTVTPGAAINFAKFPENSYTSLSDGIKRDKQTKTIDSMTLDYVDPKGSGMP
jgi:hypothetical protein